VSEQLPNSIDPARLQQIYDRTAAFYDSVAAEHQARAKLLAIELLARRPGEAFLEVGVGTAWAFQRIVCATGVAKALGIDVSPGMLDVARGRLAEAAIEGTPVLLGDARALPVASGSIDCLLTTHTLEVLPEADIAAVLAECRHVLRPGGRIVMVNLTEGEGADAAISDEWKLGYAADPEYYSGSRPLLLAPLLTRLGFKDVTRRYSGHGDGWPSEVLLARR
jgi:ubiquinone/menaquinone biosynthesis C-methylase UbiE